MTKKNRVKLIYIIIIAIAIMAIYPFEQNNLAINEQINIKNDTNTMKEFNLLIEPSLPTPYSIVNVTDNMGHLWDYTARFNLETQQIFNISARWNETVDQINITLQQSANSEFSSPQTYDTKYCAECHGTEYSNFSITTEQTVNYQYKRFRISVHMIDTDTFLSTEWQHYQIFEGEPPNADGSIILTNILYNQKSAIRISYSGCFADDPIAGVGIRAYQIARKPAADGEKINSQNFLSNIIGESLTTSYIDIGLNEEDNSYYYYGVRAVDYANYNSSIIASDKKMSPDRVAPTLSDVMILIDNAEIKSEQKYEPKGVLKIQFTVNEACKSGNITLINQAGGIVPYTFNLLPPTSGNIWSYSIDLTKPRTTGSEMQAGIYDLTINIVDLNNNVKTESISAIVEILSLEEDDSNSNQLIIIIVSCVSVALVGIIVIVKRKRNNDTSSESEIEISHGPSKSKKKGTIYKGASSIGKASGIEAENLQKRRGIAGSESKSNSSQTTKKKIVEKGTVDSNKLTKNESIKSNNDFKSLSSTDSNIDDLLSDSKPIAMKIKQAESTVDISRKMGFLTSKLDAIDQNFALMNIILEQLQTIELPKKKCQKCGTEIPISWQTCAFCSIDQYKNQLSEKIKSHRVLGQQIMCPKCHKILYPNWNKCPFCLSNN